MKLNKTLLTAYLLLFSIILCAQIPNAGFENWTKVNGIYEPDGWTTNNSPPDDVSINRDTISKEGKYGLSIFNNGPGFEPTEGVAYTHFKIPTGVDTLYAYLNIKNDMSPTHGFFYLLLESRGLSPMEKRQLVIGDTIIPEYIQVKVPLDFSQRPDSVYIKLLVGCGCLTSTSKVRVDALSFSPSLHQEQILKSPQTKDILFPNPVKEVVNLKIPEGETIKKLSIFALSGREVFSSTELAAHIDVSFLSSGEYFISVVTNEAVYKQKLIKL